MTKKKKIIITVACIVAAVIAIGAGSIAYGYDVVKKNSIGTDNAVKTAMGDAGVSEENAILTKSKMSFDDGRFVYDVEFLADGMEYDYEIKAADGTIIKKDKDVDESGRTVQPTVNETTQAQQYNTKYDTSVETTSAASTATSASGGSVQSQKTQPQTQAGDISLEEAKNIAFKNAGVTADSVTVTEARLDYDDGVSRYEIDFYNSSYKYDYEISTKGEIISFDKDNLKGGNATTSQGVTAKYIGIDKAKSLALSNAGIKSSNATFRKAKLEKDDGVWKYEIEFVSGNMEYDYEIDAVSGKIISHDIESVYD